MKQEVDLDRFDKYLMSDLSAEDCFTLSDLDGFLSALACGPEVISADDWLGIALGGEPSRVPAWVRNQIACRYIESAQGLAEDPPVVEPIF